MKFLEFVGASLFIIGMLSLLILALDNNPCMPWDDPDCEG